jgi:hypothetical protein
MIWTDSDAGPIVHTILVLWAESFTMFDSLLLLSNSQTLANKTTMECLVTE